MFIWWEGEKKQNIMVLPAEIFYAHCEITTEYFPFPQGGKKIKTQRQNWMYIESFFWGGRGRIYQTRVAYDCEITLKIDFSLQFHLSKMMKTVFHLSLWNQNHMTEINREDRDRALCIKGTCCTGGQPRQALAQPTATGPQRALKDCHRLKRMKGNATIVLGAQLQKLGSEIDKYRDNIPSLLVALLQNHSKNYHIYAFLFFLHLP